MPNGIGRRRMPDAVVAAGEVVGAIGDAPDDLAERERDHDEAEAGRAQRQQRRRTPPRAVDSATAKIAAVSWS